MSEIKFTELSCPNHFGIETECCKTKEIEVMYWKQAFTETAEDRERLEKRVERLKEALMKTIQYTEAREIYENKEDWKTVMERNVAALYLM